MSGMDTTLTDLAQLLRCEGLLDDRTSMHDADPTDVTGADCDSRVAAPGHVFICKGAAFRADYLRDALDMGAVSYLCDATHAGELAAAAPGVPALVAPDGGLRRAMALVSAEAWGHPDRDLAVLGMTGTKGKSTVANMLRSIFDAGAPADHPRAAIMGTIATYDGIESFESHNTTPESPDLWRHIANARTAGLDPMVMEVSSQALKYNRVDGLELAVGGFLNIGRDHISPIEHPDFEDYFASKLRIFEHTRTAVVNLKTDHAAEVLAAAARCDKVVTFCAGAPEAAGRAADIWADHIEPGGGTVDFVAHTPAWTATMHLSMPGLFNVDNALCAIAFALEQGVGRGQIRDGLAACRVPGRMEVVRTSDPRITAVVDFAHNKMAFENFFPSVRRDFPGRDVIAVFGAPGCKAQERRRELAEVAGAYADHIVVCEDDPGREDPADICAEIARHIPDTCPHEIVVDRNAAVERAVRLAKENADEAGRSSVVCLLAKGDDHWMKRPEGFVPDIQDRERFARAAAAVGLGVE